MNAFLIISLVGAFFILAFASPIRYLGFLLVLYSIFKKYMTDMPIFEIKGAAVYLSDIAFMMAGLYLLVAYSRGIKPWPLSNPLKIVLFMFILYGLFSMFRGVLYYGPRSVAEARKNLLFLTFSLYSVVAIRKPRDLERLLRLYYHIAVAAAVASILLTIKNYYGTGFIVRVFSANISILIGSGLIIALTSRLKNSGYFLLKKANPAAIGMLIFAILLGGHRSAWVGTFFGLVSLILLRYGTLSIKGLFKSGFVMIVAAVITLASANLLFGLFSPDEVARIQDRRLAFLQRDYQQDASASWRMVAWLQEFERIKQRPLLGSGFGNALLLPLKGEWVPLPSHSGHIEILSRQGIIGYLFFIAMIFSIFRSTLESNSRGQTAVQGKVLVLISLIIIPFFCSLFYSFGFHFWLAIGLAMHFIRHQTLELRYSSKQIYGS